MAQIALAAIHGYKRFISPHKGFLCAHNALHQNGSCSDFGLRAYAAYDMLSATRLLFRRFELCKLAAHQLRTDERRSKRDNCGNGITGCDTPIIDAISCAANCCL